LYLPGDTLLFPGLQSGQSTSYKVVGKAYRIAGAQVITAQDTARLQPAGSVPPLSRPSVPEQPPPREHHGHAVLVGGGNDLLVPHRAPGLHDGGDSRFGGGIHPVPEGEEGI
jgi:hypothetical protein